MSAINNNVGGKCYATSRLPVWHIRALHTTFQPCRVTKDQMKRRRLEWLSPR